MFSRHVTKDISAYCQGELSSEESKRFAEHIISCSRCRTKYEEIKLGIKFAEQLPKLSAPDHLWPELQAALAKQTEPGGTARSLKLGLLARPRLAAAAATLLIIVLSGFWLYNSREPTLGPLPLDERPAWAVWRLSGTPRIGSEAILGGGQLAVGEWLETDGNSRALIGVGSIGNVDIDENTRVRLLASQRDEYRLELARGKMSARIWAPPRLFFVDTPSAIAVDMGCAYTLEVDDHGGSLLRVTSGWVELQLKDRISMVPAGAACETRPGIGPGTPYFEDASDAFRLALKQVDLNVDPFSRRAALMTMLNQARRQDTLTLWHLLPRVNGEDRVSVYDKLVAFFPPDRTADGHQLNWGPEEFKDFREAILRLDEKMLSGWRYQMEPSWISGIRIGPKGKDDYLKFKKGLSPKMKQMSPK